MGWDPIGDIKKGVDNVVKEVEKGVQNVGNEAEKGAQNIGKEAEKGVQNLGKEAEKGAQNIGKEVETGAQNIGKEVEIGVQNIGKEAEKGAQNLGKVFEKAGNDTVDQVGRSYADVVQLAETSYHFIENQVDGINRIAVDAGKRIEEGKLVDAVWHAMTDPARITEQSAADAVMQSTLLNNIAAAAATAYGGPAGAAAYAAWYTYKATNSLEAALKAGAMAWATSSAGKAVSSLEGTGLDAQAKRAVASAAIGGASVAASGGSDEQVLAAFGRGAMVGVAREIYQDVTKQQLEGKGPSKAAVPKADPSVRSAYKTLGNGKLDVTSMPRDISHVGLETSDAAPGYLSPAETSGMMQDLAEIPYVNDMAYFHDQWMSLTAAEGIAVQVTILPAIVLVGAGADPTLTGPATQVVVEEEKKKE